MTVVTPCAGFFGVVTSWHCIMKHFKSILTKQNFDISKFDKFSNETNEKCVITQLVRHTGSSSMNSNPVEVEDVSQVRSFSFRVESFGNGAFLS